MRGSSRIDLSKFLFYASLCVAVLGYGIAVGHYKIFPHGILQLGKQSLFALYEDFHMLTGAKPSAHLHEARYEGSGVVRYDKKRMSPGLTFIASFFDDGLEMRLIKHHGEIVHRWKVSYFEIWPDPSFVQPPSLRRKNDWNALFHGAVVGPDASVIVNVWRGLVKLDRHGNILWKVPRMTHHSVEFASDGGFWVPGKYYLDKKSKHAPIEVPYETDMITKISADGKIEKEISVLDLFWKNNLLGVLFSNNRRFNPNPELDVIHLNDIDELLPSIAPAFAPQFQAGDLLLSLREPNMLMVIDPHTEIVKWYQVGPWIQQHDADWQPNGSITLFDNRFDNTLDGSILGGSRILGIDPKSRKTFSLYGDKEEQHFYSDTMGDHQVLENGNILITESDAGRVFEVTTTGEIVWEYINRYSDTEVAKITDALRYPAEYFTLEEWSDED